MQQFSELDVYYHGFLPDRDGFQRPARTIIQRTLSEILEKRRECDLMLIAHSTGAIIASS